MKIFSPEILAVALTALFLYPNSASAQWDYGQHAIDNIIENRIDIRKTRARMEARRRAKTKRSTSTTKRRKSNPALLTSASVKKTAVTLPSNVVFYRDTFQDFHLSDSHGYRVNFIFKSMAGKVMRRSHNFTYYESATNFKDIPVGKYRVTAEALYAGKKYPVHLGSEDGDASNPLGGNFAPFINIELKLGRDSYGTKTLLTLPDSLHVRVIE